jgi:SAM-dependent methyltransferase
MVALDAGCGKGRYSHFLAPHVRALAALDGSDAVEAAVGNLSGHENVAVVRADLFDAPFAAESFGLVVCFGVLHHLAQPRAGLAKLASLLQPGGLLCVYLYSRPSRRGVRWAALSAARVVRRLVAPLPLPVVRVLSAPIAGALYAMVVWPGDMGDRRKSRLLSGLPLASYRGKPVRSLWLDTFDRLSAPIEHRFVWAEIAPWFEELGLAVESVRDQYGLFILARRAPAGPAAGAAPPAPASA